MHIFWSPPTDPVVDWGISALVLWDSRAQDTLQYINEINNSLFVTYIHSCREENTTHYAESYRLALRSRVNS